MCNEYLKTCFDQYMDLSYNNKLGNKYEPVNLFLVDTYNLMPGLKMKNRLIQLQKVIKWNLTCHR